MCGIAGFAGGPDAPRRDASAILRQMTDAIFSRGPDEEGHQVRDGVALGARRLAIIDVAGSHQPAHGPSGRTSLVFNGEIYNFEELRAECEAAGDRFTTEGDTEVIPFLYERFGIEGCLDRLNGMFAFALWDERIQTLFLARDRLGIKPLHWAQLGDELLFGSEVKAILPHPAFQRSLDPGSLVRYLALDYVPTPRSIYQGLHKLRPGHLLTWKPGQRAKTRCWWSLAWGQPRSGDPAAGDEAGWRSLLAEELRAAVRRRLVSEVPLGALLSGGIDSSLTSALAARERPGLMTFSVGFSEPSYDESRFFKMVGERLATRHHIETLQAARFPELFEQVVGFLDEPFADGSIVPTWFLSRMVKEQGVTVVLSGDGADELFCGYPTYQAWQLAKLLDRVPRAALGLLRRGAALLPTRYENVTFDYKLKRFLEGMQQADARRHVSWLGTFLPHQLEAVVAPEVLAAARDSGAPYREVDSHWESVQSSDPIVKAGYLDLKTYMGDDILVKVDRASMATSLEVRVPYLDHRVVELAAAMPRALKLRGRRTKRLLVDVARPHLPQAILDRAKKGFGLPVAPWLRGPLKPLLDELLDPVALAATGLFRPRGVQALVDDHLSGRADRRKQLWSLLMFRRWQSSAFGC